MPSLRLDIIVFLSFYHISSLCTDSQKIVQKKSVFDTIPVNMPYVDKEVPLVYEQDLHQYHQDQSQHRHNQQLRKQKALKLKHHFQQIEIEQYTKLKSLLLRRIQNVKKKMAVNKENHNINKDRSIYMFNL